MALNVGAGHGLLVGVLHDFVSEEVLDLRVGKDASRGLVTQILRADQHIVRHCIHQVQHLLLLVLLDFNLVEEISLGPMAQVVGPFCNRTVDDKG